MARFGSVLIIEDEPGVSILLREHLKRSGFDVTQAYTFEEARGQICRQTYNFILLDIYLGERSGEELIAILKAAESRNRETPVLAMSSRMRAEVVHRIRRHVSGVLVKPLNFQQVVTRLKHLLFAPRGGSRKAA